MLFPGKEQGLLFRKRIVIGQWRDLKEMSLVIGHWGDLKNCHWSLVIGQWSMVINHQSLKLKAREIVFSALESSCGEKCGRRDVARNVSTGRRA